MRQAEGLGQRGVEVVVVGSIERVAIRARMRRKRYIPVGETVTGWRNGRSEVLDREELVGVRNHRICSPIDRRGCLLLIGRCGGIERKEVAVVDECIVAVALPASTQIRWAKVVVAALRAVQRLRQAEVGREGKSRVVLEDAAERPTAGNLLHPAMTVEDHRLPKAISLEHLANVEIRSAIGIALSL